jgi:hypothetical protein
MRELFPPIFLKNTIGKERAVEMAASEILELINEK